MKMDVTETTSNNDTVSQDNRVQVDSKKAVVEQILEYKELLKTVLSGQTEVPEETRQLLRRELLAVRTSSLCVDVSLAESSDKQPTVRGPGTCKNRSYKYFQKRLKLFKYMYILFCSNSSIRVMLIPPHT
jgi:hypothetical protein